MFMKIKETLSNIEQGVNDALGVKKRTDDIRKSWGWGVGDPFTPAIELAIKQLWAEKTFYLACLTLIPVIPVIICHPVLGTELLGTVGFVGVMSWLRRQSALRAVRKKQ